MKKLFADLKTAGCWLCSDITTVNIDVLHSPVFACWQLHYRK